MSYERGQDGARWWHRPLWMVASAVLVVTLIALAILVVVGSPDEHPVMQPPPGQAGPVGPAGALSPPNPGKPPATEVPTVAPNDVTWQLLGQVALPYSASAGPRNVSATTASGFAHTPQGALIAATQISTRASLSLGRQIYEPTIRQQIVPSPDRDKLLAGILAAPQDKPDPGTLSQFAGFSFVSYIPDNAVIRIILRAPAPDSNPYHGQTLSLLWRDGDWRLVAPPGGTWRSLAFSVVDLSGVVEWGPR